MGGYVILIIASIVDGLVEGFEFDYRRSFERKYKVNPFGFWGSKSWTRRTTHPNIYNKLMGVFDFYHVADDIRKYGYIFGGAIVLSGFELKSIVIVIITTSIAKRLGMWWIRK